MHQSLGRRCLEVPLEPSKCLVDRDQVSIRNPKKLVDNAQRRPVPLEGLSDPGIATADIVELISPDMSSRMSPSDLTPLLKGHDGIRDGIGNEEMHLHAELCAGVEPLWADQYLADRIRAIDQTMVGWTSQVIEKVC